MISCDICLSLTYFSQYDNLQGHPCCCKWHYFILFYSRVVFHYICVPHLYHSSFNRHLSFFHVLAVINCAATKHRVACIFLNYSFVLIYNQEWDCWIAWQLYFQFFEEPPYWFVQRLYQLTFLPTVQESSLLSPHPLQHLLFVDFSKMAILTNVR